MVSLQAQLNGLKSHFLGWTALRSSQTMTIKIASTSSPQVVVDKIQEYLHHWRTVLLVVSYLNHADIKSLYRAQGEKVADVMEKVEKEVATFWDKGKWNKKKEQEMQRARTGLYRAQIKEYEIQNLGSAYLDFLKRFHGDMSERTYKFLEDYAPGLADHLTELTKRKKDAEKDAKVEKVAAAKKVKQENAEKLGELHKVMEVIDKERELYVAFIVEGMTHGPNVPQPWSAS